MNEAGKKREREREKGSDLKIASSAQMKVKLEFEEAKEVGGGGWVKLRSSNSLGHT